MMASQALSFTLAPGMAPAAPLMRMLSRFDRQKLEAFAEISIAMLDLMDPDPDTEDADPAESDGTDQGDQSAIEWTSLHPSFKRNGSPGLISHEDDEDGDADTEHDGREVTGAEDDFMSHGGVGPGCPISDPDDERQ